MPLTDMPPRNPSGDLFVSLKAINVVIIRMMEQESLTEMQQAQLDKLKLDRLRFLRAIEILQGYSL